MEHSYLIDVWNEKSRGERAVDGLIGGVVGGAVMALFLAGAGLYSGTSMAITLGIFDPARNGGWLNGLLAHLAVSAIYGVVFALLLQVVAWARPSLLKMGWVWGLAYGVVLFAIALRLAGTPAGAPLGQIGLWQFGVAHLMYGVTAGWWLGKNR